MKRLWGRIPVPGSSLLSVCLSLVSQWRTQCLVLHMRERKKQKQKSKRKILFATGMLTLKIPQQLKKTSQQNSVKIPPVLDSVETSFSSAKWLIYNNSFGRIEWISKQFEEKEEQKLMFVLVTKTMSVCQLKLNTSWSWLTLLYKFCQWSPDLSTVGHCIDIWYT